jgi:hypothetical protein
MDEGADATRYPSSPDLGDLRRRLAETYARGAEVLEQTARLADEHADREARQGRTASAAAERAEAARARDAAARCRTNAERLR